MTRPMSAYEQEPEADLTPYAEHAEPEPGPRGALAALLPYALTVCLLALLVVACVATVHDIDEQNAKADRERQVYATSAVGAIANMVPPLHLTTTTVP